METAIWRGDSQNLRKRFSPFIDKPRKTCDFALHFLIPHSKLTRKQKNEGFLKNIFLLFTYKPRERANTAIKLEIFLSFIGSSRKQQILSPFFEICLENKKSAPRKERIWYLISLQDYRKIHTIIDFLLKFLPIFQNKKSKISCKLSSDGV